MEKIKVTEYGEYFIAMQVAPWLGEHTEKSKLLLCIGVHEICKGFIDLKEISESYNAIVCRSCGLRVILPNSIKTYGDLRKHFDKGAH